MGMKGITNRFVVQYGDGIESDGMPLQMDGWMKYQYKKWYELNWDLFGWDLFERDLVVCGQMEWKQNR